VVGGFSIVGADQHLTLSIPAGLRSDLILQSCSLLHGDPRQPVLSAIKGDIETAYDFLGKKVRAPLPEFTSSCSSHAVLASGVRLFGRHSLT